MITIGIYITMMAARFLAVILTILIRSACTLILILINAIVERIASQSVKTEETDMHIYTELEAYQHQMVSNRSLCKSYEEEMKRLKVLNRGNTLEARKLDKKIADTEARIGGIEKKIRKLGDKYNIDVEQYL